MAWAVVNTWISRAGVMLRRQGGAVLKVLRKLLLGRRFIHSLEQNRAAADRLDCALKEIFDTPR